MFIGFFQSTLENEYNFSWYIADIRQHRQIPPARKMNVALFLMNYFMEYNNMSRCVFKSTVIIISYNSEQLSKLSQCFDLFKINMSEQDQYQQMLTEIRNTLTSGNGSLTAIQQQPSELSDLKIRQYLTQSYQIVQKNQFTKAEDPNLIYNKISEASVLLKTESDMIKNYVKDKIQAQVFSVRNPAGVNQKQYEKLMQIKEKLEKKRLAQKLEQSKKIESMIQSARKYKNYENKAQVPLPQLESLLHQQRACVDNVVKEEIKIKSSNNMLLGNESYRIEPFGQKIEKKKSRISKQEQQSFQIQIVGVEEDENSFMEKKASVYDHKISEVLKSKKNFLKIFTAFLTEQVRKMQIEISTPNEQQALSNTQKQKKKMRFFNQLNSEGTSYQIPFVGIRQLSYSYKFKVFVETKQQQEEKKIKDPLIRKLVSKRIGTSNKYHMKQCIVKDNIFYYSDQQSNESEVKLKDMKSILIGINPIEQKTQTKEEGSFFQNKENEIQVVVVKGVNRDFVFELGVGEGPQLKLQLSKINLRRLHKINCILGGRSYEDMSKFIEQQSSILNLSDGYLRAKDEYSHQEMRQNFLKLLTGLFSQRKNTRILNFQNCGLGLEEFKMIIKQCEKHFRNVQVFNFSYTKLDKQALKTILELIIKCSSNNLQLNLSFCGLVDQVILSNLSILSEVCYKTKVLQLQGNQLSYQSIKNLGLILHSSVSQVKLLSLSIEDFGQLTSLIKEASKLQVVKVNSAEKLSLDQKQMQMLVSCTSQKQELRRIQLKGIGCKTIKWLEQISPYLAINIELSNVLANRSIQSKFLRVSLK